MLDKTYHHENLRDDLLKLAFRKVQREGPESLNLRELARQAGVSHMAVYRHFPQYNDLLSALTTRIVTLLGDRIERVLFDANNEHKNTYTQLKILCQGYVLFARDEPNLYQTIWSKRVNHPSLFELDERDDIPYQLLCRMVDALIAEKHIALADRQVTILAIWSLASGLATLVADGPLHAIPPAQQEAYIEGTLVRGLKGIVG